MHCELLVQINMGDDVFAVRPKVLELIVAHVLHALQLVISISRNELLNDHEASTNTDDKLAVENLSVDLLGSEPVLATSDLAQRNRAVGCIDVASQHLVEGITLRNIEDRRLVDTLLLTNAPVHDIDDLVFVLQSHLNLLDLLDLGLDGSREFIKPLNELLFV